MLRMALVGVGRWGANYLGILGDSVDGVTATLGGTHAAKLVALCDADPAALARAATRVRVPSAVRSLGELDPASVDAVIIATPTESHARLACEAFERGLHVLVEKPLAMTSAEALDVISAADAAGKVLAVGYQMLHHPAHVALVREAARLGPLRHVRTLRSSVRRERQDPVLVALGPHDLATLAVVSGRADFVCDGAEGDGVTSLTARLRSVGSGLTAELRFSRGTPVRITEVAGRDGTATLDEATGIVRVNGSEVFSAPHARPLDLQVADFVARIAEGAPAVGPEPLMAISRLLEVVQAEVARPVADRAPLQLSPA